MKQFMSPNRLIVLVALGLLGACSPTSSTPTAAVSPNASNSAQSPKTASTDQDSVPLELSEEEWRARLTPEQFRVLREQGTERAFSGKLNAHYEDGQYLCAACGHPVFSSATKFDSRTGWPSFYDPLTPESIGTTVDNSLSQERTEVHCANCGGHLGHVFRDGPKPTGLRYCLNSVSLTFTPAQ